MRDMLGRFLSHYRAAGAVRILVTVAAFSFLLVGGEFVFALSLDDQRRGATGHGGPEQDDRLVWRTRWNDLMAVATTVALPIVAVFAGLGLARRSVGGLTAGSGQGEAAGRC